VLKSSAVIRVFLFVAILLLAVLGVPLARRFVYGYFHGTNVFVFVESGEKTLLYKNPREMIGLEDDPLETIPPELLDPKLYETYYDVCWFNSGTLIRCGHSYHGSPQNALYCEQIKVEGSFIAKVMEER